MEPILDLLLFTSLYFWLSYDIMCMKTFIILLVGLEGIIPYIEVIVVVVMILDLDVLLFVVDLILR